MEIRTGGMLVTVVGPAEARPAEALAIDFVVESDRAQLSEIVQRVRDGRLRRTSAMFRLSMMQSLPLIRPSDAAGRRSSAFVPKPAITKPLLSGSVEAACGLAASRFGF
jgi:hypothetical protein